MNPIASRANGTIICFFITTFSREGKPSST
jgi:hypothetical protein